MGQEPCLKPPSCPRPRNGGGLGACLALPGLPSSHKVQGWWDSHSSEGCPGLSVRLWGLLLECDMSGSVGSKRQSAGTGLSKSTAGCFEPFLLVTLSGLDS